MIRKRNKLHKRAKETGSDKKKWKQLRSDIKSEITSSHNKYVENMIGNIKEISKPFWKYISSKRIFNLPLPVSFALLWSLLRFRIILLIDCVIHGSDFFSFTNMIGNIKEISKPFWKYISSKRKDTQSIPPLDTKQGTTTESDVDNVFESFF
jgi:hypothetical protein